ncbi:MAG TPA: transposase, partial [Actinomycetota bacterium]|nr:transposase [Actinomycetota bacterium]
MDEGFRVVAVTAGDLRRLNRRWGEVVVPKVGWVRFRLTRPLGKHGMARVTKDRASRWHVSFSAPQPPVVRT